METMLGRFLSPDNYACPDERSDVGMQAPDYSQNFNRYSYALNNPLKYTDPDGEWVQFVIGALVGGTINWITHGAEFNLEGLGYFGVGALAGALAAGIGAGVGGLASGAGSFSFSVSGGLTVGGVLPGAAVGASVGFTSSFITGTGNSLLQNDNIGNSLMNGLKAGAIGGAMGAITGGVAGGIRAGKYGGNLWSGRIAPVVIPRETLNIPNSDLSYGWDDPSHFSRPKINSLLTDKDLTFDGGTLSLRQNYMDGSNSVVDSWPAVSGPWGKGALPEGEWHGYSITRLNLKIQANFNSYSRDGFDFWMRLNPQFETTRSGIGIHPDGQSLGQWWFNNGTNGCIGLQSTHDGLQNFYNDISAYLSRNLSISVYVNY